MMWHANIIYAYVYVLFCLVSTNDGLLICKCHRSFINRNHYHQYVVRKNNIKYNDINLITSIQSTTILTTAVVIPDSSSDRSYMISKPKKIDNIFEKICLYILTKILSIYTHTPLPTYYIINNSNKLNFGSYDKFVAISKVLEFNL